MLKYSSVTPKSLYLSRCQFLAGAPVALGFASGLAFANSKLTAVKSPFSSTERPTPYQDVISYNNFYEFGTGKGDPVRNAKNFRTTPWSISIEGAVSKPQVLVWIRSSSSPRMKSASISIVVSRHGPSSCPGSGSR